MSTPAYYPHFPLCGAGFPLLSVSYHLKVMHRIRHPQKLPGLKALLPDYRGLPREHTQIFALLEAIRKLAGSLQTNEAQPFYSTREIAAFFGVSQPTVVRVYRELEAEGLLARRRSALTMLAPRERRPRTPVRGVVGLPIWSYGHSHYSDWRVFFMRIEEHLRRHAFVADFIFFQRDDPRLPDEVGRYLDHELDALVWLFPLSTYNGLLLQLADQGVAVSVVVDQRVRFAFPTYAISWETATQRALIKWKQDGIRRIAISSQSPSFGPIESATKRLGLELVPPESADPLTALRKWERLDDLGVILPDAMWGSTFARNHPQVLLDLLRQRRVLLFYHLEIERALLAGVQVDYAVQNWDRIAAHIADEIASGTLRRQKSPALFQAEYHGRVAAETFAQVF